MREVWLTKGQLNGPYPGLGSKEDADEMVKTAKSRPHKTNSGLRKAGIKEFQHFVEWDDKSLAEEEKATVSNEAVMEEAEYEMVKRDMQCVMEGSEAAQVAAVDDNQTKAAAEKKDGRKSKKPKVAVKENKAGGTDDLPDGEKLEEAKKALDKQIGKKQD